MSVERTSTALATSGFPFALQVCSTGAADPTIAAGATVVLELQPPTFYGTAGFMSWDSGTPTQIAVVNNTFFALVCCQVTFETGGFDSYLTWQENFGFPAAQRFSNTNQVSIAAGSVLGPGFGNYFQVVLHNDDVVDHTLMDTDFVFALLPMPT